MKVVIIFDSIFGNTAKVAHAMADAIKTNVDVKAIQVGQFSDEDLKDCTHLLIGSPTRAFGPTSAIKQMLANLDRNSLQNVKISVFDTRMAIDEIDVKILKFLEKRLGYASDTMQKIIKRRLKKQSVPWSSYIVNGSEGPLREGELQRAEAWAVEQIQ
ncbi:MAG: hypothetical protein JEZ00_01840 [Anaerolineaceae bacterium]|nr:hypothetical protein [Anaerolineaceae bacterium]